MVRIFFLVCCTSVFFQGCTQLAFVRTEKNIKKIRLGDEELLNPAQGGELVRIKSGFGSLPYETTDSLGNKISGSLLRTEINWPIAGSAIGATALTLPVFTLLGFLAANPSFVSLINIFQKNGSSVGFAYIEQSLSAWTLPTAFLFSLLGSLPLLGFLRAELIPDQMYFLPGVN